MQLWHILILGHVFSMVIGQYIGKVFVHKIHPYQILFYQYLASITIVSFYIAFLKPQAGFFDVPLWLIVIGFMYAIGVSAVYHAKKQSLSKTGLMSKGANLIAILLAVIFLGELQLLSMTTINGAMKLSGLVLMIIAIILFYQKKTHKGSEESFDYKIWVKSLYSP